MHDMALGNYHVSVADLPRDLSPLVDALHENGHDVRRMLAPQVAAARQCIEARTAPLSGSLNEAPHPNAG
jgi:hypothetical protein